MMTAFAILVTVHGLIHLLGVAKAFHLAELPQLTQPISPFFGALWLMSALFFVVTAVSLVVAPRRWWLIGACGVLVSMFVIVPSWPDAQLGAAANAVVSVGVMFGFLSQGPFSLRGEYEREVASCLAGLADAPPVTDADLAHLPAAVQRYLRAASVVGQPRIRNVHVTMHGRIRAGRHDRWMPFAAEQYNFADPPGRCDDLFLLALADVEGQDIVLRECYLDDIVAGCVRDSSVVARARGITITVDAVDDVAIRGDEELLRRMVMNLLDNAVRYGPERTDVRVSVSQDSSVATLIVEDSGPGIPDADRERVFERFVRLQTARTAAGGGLGLPIARWIAEQHHGSLHLEPSARGCRFVAMMPLQPAAVSARDAREASQVVGAH
jgi:anti-sigma regulatory factor (Ser/Thr protein kinase)